MEQYNEDKLNKAKKKVKEIKGFYSHLTVYIIINVFLILAQMGLFTPGGLNWGMPGWAYFTTPFFWGIGLFFHGLYVFQHKFRFFKEWEERKIKQYMEKEEEELKSTKWD